MRKNNYERVQIPGSIVWVDLPPKLATAARIIFDAGAEGASTVDLMLAGVFSVSNTIYRLRGLGAEIATEKKTVIDNEGGKHKCIGHYIFHRWN